MNCQMSTIVTMRIFTAGIQRLRSLVTLRRADRSLDDEMQFHLEMETRRLIQTGVSEAAARAEAIRSFGGVARHRDDARDARGVSIVEDFITDVRLGARAFRRQPGFVSVVVLTLAV